MSIIKRLAWLMGKSRDDPEEPIDMDKDGNQLYEEDVVSFVKKELEDRKAERKPYELQWILNSNFLNGNQYCDINIGEGAVKQYPTPNDYMEREVFNKIAPLYDTRIANLKKLNFSAHVKPRTDEDDDHVKADISTNLLRYTAKNLGFNDKKDTALSWAELTGTAFILSWWNSDAGDVVDYIEKTTIGEDGIEKTESVPVFGGDIDIGLINPFEVYPESTMKSTIDEQRSIILERVMTEEDIYDQYRVKLTGTDIDTYAVAPVVGANGYGYEATVMTLTTKKVKNAEKVLLYFERPGRRYPNGRMIILIQDRVIWYSDLPYKTIPITMFKSKEVAGQFFGKSFIQDVIPLQRAYNGCMNSINQYAKRVALNAYVVEEGAVADTEELEDIANQPGAILTYNRNHNPPKPLELPPLPSVYENQIRYYATEMEYAAGVSQLMVIGATPTGVTSGTAMNTLREIDNTRLALTGDNIRNAFIELNKTWLEIYSLHADGYRVIRILGSNSAGQALVWCRDDITSYDVEFDTENELIHSEQAKSERFLQAYQMNLFADDSGKVPQAIKDKAIEALRLNNFDELLSMNDLQRKAAQREQIYLKYAHANPLVNPLLDDHMTHYEEHLRFALQLEFKMLQKNNPQEAESFMRHIDEHRNYIIQAQGGQ